ncbi:stage III sporulation protein AF [Paenibacillus ehimensis]|uniref:Stage III sporulation protein AF n=2 Tax=Paenibacillus ehimensis TaxID=79264 RepID=A0ABT8V6H1_9BACL|nr:stage III sporulation protein AF [Paenibacillus ehimensis]MDO3677041.1 stage III sporulation protein AF [Paenibacillus ehimensis]MEC0209372.1 stage III sporulation protein AF [Paenibacillus ehimensis]
MDFLSGWLKSIVMVILLATFVDLLLPNRSMQRYVKTVIGLFLLLSLLQPLFSLLGQRSQLDERIKDALITSGAASPGRLAGGAAGEVESLPATLQRAEALKAKQQEQSRKLVETQAAGLMKRSIEQKAGVKVRSIQVETAPDSEGQLVIRSVSLALEPQTPVRPVTDTAARPDKGIEPVQPVEPVAGVDIRIGEPQSRPVSRMKNGESDENKLPPEWMQKKTQILLLLEQDWQVGEEQIRLELAVGR